MCGSDHRVSGKETGYSTYNLISRKKDQGETAGRFNRIVSVKVLNRYCRVYIQDGRSGYAIQVEEDLLCGAEGECAETLRQKDMVWTALWKVEEAPMK